MKESLSVKVDVATLESMGFCPGIYREGFLFAASSKSDVFDAIVIRSPESANCWSPRYPATHNSLEEHIAFINRHHLERAVIIAENLDFLPHCPSLNYLVIIPADTAPKNFDYSSLYQIPEVNYLCCATKYGGRREPHKTQLDYSKVHGLRSVYAVGAGHVNLEKSEDLEILDISGNKSFCDLQKFDSCKKLKEIRLFECGVKNLNGIENFQELETLTIGRCFSLSDVSMIASLSSSLKTLCIENCAKIEDFSFLFQLQNLEHLTLSGSNKLPDLTFIRSMKKLKLITFSMEVENGDLTPCLSVPYADCLKAKRYYNLSNKDLPKTL